MPNESDKNPNKSSAPEEIFIKGAAEHNLKNISLAIPKFTLTVFTGVSGSGKSSLAFDTLYAEGQRRYVESLSAYARQFLGQMDKPKYEYIKGLSPTISIEQKTASHNPRSTVGTITEIADYLRVLWARAGTQHCHICGEPVGVMSSSEIVSELERIPENERFYLTVTVVENRKGEFRELLAELRKRGFSRIIENGTIKHLDEIEKIDKKKKTTLELVVDRLISKPDNRKRLADSVELALKEGDGKFAIIFPDRKNQKKLFSTKRYHCGHSFPELSPQSFSFNAPQGMCPACNGLGTILAMDPDKVVPDKSLSIRQGAIKPWASFAVRKSGWNYEIVQSVAKEHGISLDTPWKDLPEKHKYLLLYGAANRRYEVNYDNGNFGRSGYLVGFEGILTSLMRRMKETQSEEMRQYYQKFLSNSPCAECKGTRLRQESRAVLVGDKSIVEISKMSIADAFDFFENIKLEGNARVIAVELIKEIKNRLGFLLDVGLEYLSLDRTGPTLSGGESQRLRLASQIGSELTGVIYILDEPSIGLHQRDNLRLLRTLKRLRDSGNTVIVVEHDLETMEQADYIIDFGPGAGRDGGRIVAQGAPEKVAENPLSLTGKYLSGKEQIEFHKPRGNASNSLKIEGASQNNLKNISVSFPLGRFIAVTGVSGAGKSSLINETLYPALLRHLHSTTTATPGPYKLLSGLEFIDKVVNIDQSPIGRTPRSNPATYTKVFDHIRTLFAQTPTARAYGYKPGRFSFNVKEGTCEKCEGDGMIRVEMHFLPDVYVTCDACGGKRFNEATLRALYKGLNISDVLNLTVNEAIEHFQVHRNIVQILQTLKDVGLGYLHLGQPSPTLSGGEAQRVKLSRELAKRSTGKTIYLLDEPTTGLHFDDIKKLLAVLHRLVDEGNTVIVIEHNLDVIKNADYIIDMGPEGGDKGGEIIGTGTPIELSENPNSYTGRFLKELFAKRKVHSVSPIYARARRDA
ncbi:MAG: excinuclease ABC subunit UvrA [Myxococcota bacterium]